MLWTACLLAAIAGTSCGYHVAGRGDQIPKNVKTVAVLPFANATPRYKIEQDLTRAVVHEFITRTRFAVTSEESAADAVLRGAVVNLYVTPLIFDPVSNRATSVQITAQMQITLTDRRTGQILYQNQNFQSRERYEVAIDPRAYFDESEVGMQRMSQDVARDLVSSILEKF
jgi:hypothetical protein